MAEAANSCRSEQMAPTSPPQQQSGSDGAGILQLKKRFVVYPFDIVKPMRSEDTSIIKINDHLANRPPVSAPPILHPDNNTETTEFDRRVGYFGLPIVDEIMINTTGGGSIKVIREAAVKSVDSDRPNLVEGDFSEFVELHR